MPIWRSMSAMLPVASANADSARVTANRDVIPAPYRRLNSAKVDSNAAGAIFGDIQAPVEFLEFEIRLRNVAYE